MLKLLFRALAWSATRKRASVTTDHIEHEYEYIDFDGHLSYEMN